MNKLNLVFVDICYAFKFTYLHVLFYWVYKIFYIVCHYKFFILFYTHTFSRIIQTILILFFYVKRMIKIIFMNWIQNIFKQNNIIKPASPDTDLPLRFTHFFPFIRNTLIASWGFFFISFFFSFDYLLLLHNKNNSRLGHDRGRPTVGR